jgi:pyridoxal phosphate enzyme (YggS family)
LVSEDQSEPGGFAAVKKRIEDAARAAERNPSEITVVAVSKTFPAETVRPLLLAGHRDFGENRVQEAKAKWPELKKAWPDTRLHLVGPLQSNKAAEAIRLFDVIHTIDREKLAQVIADELRRQERAVELFIQVNTGEEEQKSGVAPEQADDLIALCRDELKLPIVGLMCLPPLDDEAAFHFALLAKIARRNALSKLSMGMSGDFETAISFGATHVRVGSAIFGERTTRSG